METRDWIFLLFILSFSFFARFYLQKYNRIANSEEVGQIEVAYAISQGLGLQTYGAEDSIHASALHPSDAYPPLTATLIYPFIRLLGFGPTAIRWPFVILGTLIVAAVYVVARKQFNTKVAVIASLLASVNYYLLLYSTTAMTEAPFIFFSLLTFICLSDLSKGRGYAILTGVFLGLSYLTRYAHGIALTAAVVVYFLVYTKSIRKNAAYVFFTALLTILPWLIRNYYTFGTPFYSLTAYWSLVEPEKWAEIHNIGYAPPTFSGLLAEMGVIKFAVYLIKRASVSSSIMVLYNTPIVVGSGMILLSLLALVYIRRKELPVFTISFYLFTVFILGSALRYSRYLVEVLPFIIILATFGFVNLFDMFYNEFGKRLEKHSGKKPYKPYVFALTTLILISSVFITSVYELRSTYNKDYLDGKFYEVGGNWIRENTDAETIVMVFKLPYFFFARRPLVIIPNGTAAQILQSAEKFNVNYIILDHKLVLDRPGALGIENETGVEVVFNKTIRSGEWVKIFKLNRNTT